MASTRHTFAVLLYLQCASLLVPVNCLQKTRQRRQTSTCTTEAGVAGSCTTIQQCPSLNALLAQVKQRQAPPDALAQLRRATFKCPFVSGSPRVCCGDRGASGGGGSFNGRVTTLRPFRPQPTRRPSSRRPFTQRPTTPPRGITFVQSSRPSISQAPRPSVSQAPRPSVSRPARPSVSQTRRPSVSQTARPASGGPRMPLPTEEECGRRTFAARVFGGRDASIGSWPWAASIGYRVRGRRDIVWACGGALITSRHVLTAAHCISGLPAQQMPEKVRLGELDFDRDPDCLKEDPSVCADRPIDAPIIGLIAHQGFTGRTNNAFADDIGLITLGLSIRSTDFIRPICLPLDLSRLSRGTDSGEGKPAFIAGWGRSENFASFTPNLQEARILLRSPAVCEAAYRRQLTRGLGNRLCAGSGNGVDTCRGDSGGPLMMPSTSGSNWYLAGVTSIGSSSCGEDPAIYTRVHDYMNWIQSSLQVAI